MVPGVVDDWAAGELVDHVAHDSKALAEIAQMVVADAGSHHGLGPLFLVAVLLAGSHLEMDPSTLIGTLAIEEMVAQNQMSGESDTASRVALDHRLPNLDGLSRLIGFITGLPRFQQFGGRPILDQRAWRRSCRSRPVGPQSGRHDEGPSQQEPKAIRMTHGDPPSQMLLGQVRPCRRRQRGHDAPTDDPSCYVSPYHLP